MINLLFENLFLKKRFISDMNVILPNQIYLSYSRTPYFGEGKTTLNKSAAFFRKVHLNL